MAIPSGLSIDIVSQTPTAAGGRVLFAGYGTYTAADFTIGARPTYTNPNVQTVATQLTYGGLGFTPTKVRVLNLTDRTETVAYIDSDLGTSNAEGVVTIADGTRTYAAHGITVTAKQIVVDVTVAGPITDDDDFIIECWA